MDSEVRFSAVANTAYTHLGSCQQTITSSGLGTMLYTRRYSSGGGGMLSNLLLYNRTS
jgi:hypothetical protein